MAMPFLDVLPKKKTKHRSAPGEIDHLLRSEAYVTAHPDKDDLQWQATFRLPPWADGSPLTFFTASETHEGQGWYWAFVVRCTLPRTLAREAQIALGWRFIERMMPAFAGLVVLHEPMASDGLPQPHLHILYSARLLDEHFRPPEQFFTRYDARHPAWGGARKDPQVLARQYPGILHAAWYALMVEDAAPREEVPHGADVVASSVLTESMRPEPLSVTQRMMALAAGFTKRSKPVVVERNSS